LTVTFSGVSALKSRAEEDRLGRCCPTGPAEQDPRPDTLHAFATIDYGDGEPGFVLYLKAAYHKAFVRNVGVRSYALANPAFPHESGGDQFLTESQFEGYRALGYELMDEILNRALKDLDPATARLSDIFQKLGASADTRP